MARTLLSKTALEQAALVQIRSCYGCEDVTAVVIDWIADPRFDTNWAISALKRSTDVELGLTAKLHTVRAIDGTQQRLRKLYDLQTD